MQDVSFLGTDKISARSRVTGDSSLLNSAAEEHRLLSGR